jgi:hypothetical protein
VNKCQMPENIFDAGRFKRVELKVKANVDVVEPTGNEIYVSFSLRLG